MGRTFFDITELVNYARHFQRVGGIQRVCLTLVAHLFERHRASAIGLIYFDVITGRFMEMDSAWCHPGYDFDGPRFRSTLFGDPPPERVWPIESHAGRIAGPFAERLFRGARRRILQPPPRVSNDANPRPVEIAAGDVCVLIGATWAAPGHIAELRQIKDRGAEIVPLMYDMIPLKVPGHLPASIGPIFRAWLDSVYAVADRLLAISEASADDFRRDMAERLPRPLQVTATPLAQEFLSRPGGGVRASVRWAARPRYVLWVGTIEARKNAWGVVVAWQRLVGELGSAAPRLVMAGRRGWGIEPLNALLASTRNLGGKVAIIEDATDGEVASLYRRCLFAVYPSFHEGWGLPVGEALWFGKTCLTSNVSALPEAGGDMCDYVDPDDPDAIYRGIKRLVVDREHRRSLERRIDRAKLRTWAQVADDVFAAAAGDGPRREA